MEPGEEHDALLQELKGKMEQLEQQENMVRQHVQTETPRYRFCTNCGAKVLATSKFCTDCGAQLNI